MYQSSALMNKSKVHHEIVELGLLLFNSQTMIIKCFFFQNDDYRKIGNDNSTSYFVWM
jgi:hypothetical protein